MSPRTITSLAVIFMIAATIAIARPSLPADILSAIEQLRTNSEELTDGLASLNRAIFTPPPLRAPANNTEPAILTTDGVFTETNRHRAQEDVPALARNATLDQAAANKVQDMFDQQYFEHVSPDGRGPADVVEAVGYDYILVGENLALGNFPSDVNLVQAWMDSPGHRANILNEHFTEIGLAVAQGQFEGQTTWLAVQTFATPASVCPPANASLKTAIEQQRARADQLQQSLASGQLTLETLQLDLEQLKTDIEQLIAQGNQHIADGNAEIEEGNRQAEAGNQEAAAAHWKRGQRLQEQGRAKHAQAQSLQQEFDSTYTRYQEAEANYNNQVAEFNALQNQLEQQITTFNRQAQAFNTCAAQYQ